MGAALELDKRELSEVSRSGIYLHKPGKIQISVCHCFNCHMNHADQIVEKIQKELGLGRDEWISKDGMISFDNNLKSIGLCSRGVMMKINQTYYFGMTVSKVAPLIRKLQNEYGTLPIEEIVKSI